ncbi:hypothetical protein GLYMA_01G215151v4 [Glycine max]|nr:hypothetical protein GLYMA_01G215151v4 [Glycine max]KAH1164234.1 hypothetical protein GYH30_002324 [Glycine max]
MSLLHILLLKSTLLSSTIMMWVLRLLEQWEFQWNSYVVVQELRASSPSLMILENPARIDQC